MSSKKPKVVKLKRRKIKIKSAKSCETLQIEYDEGKIVKSISNPDYQSLLYPPESKHNPKLPQTLKNSGILLQNIK